MYAKVRQKSTNRNGFTLVEVIVVLAIQAILAVAVSNTIVSFYQFNAYAMAQAYQVETARRGIGLMVRDLREMTYADDGTFPIATTSDTQIGFYSDIDRDDSVEYVRYALSSTTLMKYIYGATGTPLVYSTSTPESTVILSEYVQNQIQGIPIFVYFDQNGNPTTATSTFTDIRYIQVSVIVNVDPIRDPGQFLLRSSASLRNLKSYE